MVNLDINQFIMQRRTSNGVNGFCGMYSSGAMLIYSFYFSLPKIQDGHNIWLKKTYLPKELALGTSKSIN